MHNPYLWNSSAVSNDQRCTLDIGKVPKCINGEKPRRLCACFRTFDGHEMRSALDIVAGHPPWPNERQRGHHNVHQALEKGPSTIKTSIA